MIEQKIQEFISCIENHQFYEAHEALEEVWFPRRFEEDDEVKLLKGFINAAVSFELLKRGRFPQSERVWKNYLKYLPHLELLQKNPHHKSYALLAHFLQKQKSSLTSHYCSL